MTIAQIKIIAKKQGSFATRIIFACYGKVQSEECFIENIGYKRSITVKQYNKLKELNLCECRLNYI